MKQAALALAAKGWAVLPCNQSKAPLTTHGHKDATTHPAQVEQWWTQHPDALIGIRIPAGLCVLDIDPRNGGSLDTLQQHTGELPHTLTTLSGRGDGGRHMWFKQPAGTLTATRLPTGVDLKLGGRGYCIAPPSLHPATGQPYQWQPGPIAALPPKAVTLLTVQTRTITPGRSRDERGLVRTVLEAAEGNRNRALYWAACRAVEEGAPAVLQQLHEAALAAGLTENETTRTIHSAERTAGGAR